MKFLSWFRRPRVIEPCEGKHRWMAPEWSNDHFGLTLHPTDAGWAWCSACGALKVDSTIHVPHGPARAAAEVSK
jgi:hypothetical protein